MGLMIADLGLMIGSVELWEEDFNHSPFRGRVHAALLLTDFPSYQPERANHSSVDTDPLATGKTTRYTVNRWSPSPPTGSESFSKVAAECPAGP